MIYAPIALPFFLLLLALLAVFVFVVELEVLAYAYRKIGVRPRYVFGLLLLSLLGSHVNIPLYAVPVAHVSTAHEVSMFGWTYVVPGTIEKGVTVVAINVGGAVIPILLSIYLVVRSRMYWRMLIGTAIVAVLVHSWARIEPGLGIAVPIFLPPLIAAGVGLLLAFRRDRGRRHLRRRLSHGHHRRPPGLTGAGRGGSPAAPPGQPRGRRGGGTVR